MNTSELLEKLKALKAEGKDEILIEKNSSRDVRVVLKIKFEVSELWTQGFCFMDWHSQHVLDILNSTACAAVIL